MYILAFLHFIVLSHFQYAGICSLCNLCESQEHVQAIKTIASLRPLQPINKLMSLLHKDTWRLGQNPSWIRTQLCAFNTPP